MPPVTAAAEACSLLGNVKLKHKALAQAALRQMAVAENLMRQGATVKRVKLVPGTHLTLYTSP